MFGGGPPIGGGANPIGGIGGPPGPPGPAMFGGGKGGIFGGIGATIIQS